MSALTRVDPIDGPQRYCRPCDEWWPDDEEFWYPDVRRAGTPYNSAGRILIRKWDYTYRHCRACQATAARRYRERFQSWMTVLGPVPCQNCGQNVVWNGWEWRETLTRRHDCARNDHASLAA